MQLIHDHLHHFDPSLPRVPVKVDRQTLARRRWRAEAADGADFGFDLAHPLANGDVIFSSAIAVYVIEQIAEPILEVPLTDVAADAARLGWIFGNLHFPIQIVGDSVLVADDPAVRQACEREHLPFHARERVFLPYGVAAHTHHHAGPTPAHGPGPDHSHHHEHHHQPH